MKEFVEKLREKADTFEKSGCAVEGIVKDYRKSADMIEKLCGENNIGEFVKKLIERLEELKKIEYDREDYSSKKDYYDDWEEPFADGESNGKYYAYTKAIKIVNQLAEEFATDIKVTGKSQTRIEHLRSMSVEELADDIMQKSEISTTIDFCQNFSECEKIMDKGENISDEMCKKCLIKYLNSPVEQKKVIPKDYYMERFTEVN